MVEKCCNVVVNKNEMTLCAFLGIQVAWSHESEGHSAPAPSIEVSKEIPPKVQSQKVHHSAKEVVTVILESAEI